MLNKLKLCIVAALAGMGVFALSAHADESKIPEPFRGASPGSPIQINYGDWNRILQITVLDAGRSSGRGSTSTPRPEIGTRVVHGNTKSTRNEGNRLYFKAFANNPANLKALDTIRTELEKVPDQAPLKLWDEHEQLAYWLNLYNITLIEEISKEYPVRSLKKLKYGRHSLWDKKVLKVSGVPLSLNDIHNIIINKWDSSLVMYGMFQGYIGGPNIMDEAFTGDNVHKLLIQNAKEFISTSRGMRFSGKKLRVSDYYEENKALFPHFKKDLKDHLAKLTEDPAERARIMDIKHIEAKTNDYYIADLSGGIAHASNASASNRAALTTVIVHAAQGYGTSKGEGANLGMGEMNIDNYADFKTYDVDLRFPDFVKDYLKQVHKNKSLMKGDVQVEEYDDTAKKKKKEDKPKK
ncbi:DUF547 domain-containing protein [Kordiimonas marina]|uniref:DUF547 domain-containing protein n=1 Tax=Kordiimonas marina TaxID=2872312 RepID=UPI001FF5114C|nr:DUF547 domain-containing protein [Kordiimonas marina]MCJ9429737.1 DUF547 domain-containing protein [Kordiimonas marina]